MIKYCEWLFVMDFLVFQMPVMLRFASLASSKSPTFVVFTNPCNNHDDHGLVTVKGNFLSVERIPFSHLKEEEIHVWLQNDMRSKSGSRDGPFSH
jgi:hypothetical protein